MPRQFIDLSSPSLQGGLSRKPEDLPHGKIVPPDLVRETVARQKAKFPPEIYTTEAEERDLNQFTIQYYFDYLGYEVLYRKQPGRAGSAGRRFRRDVGPYPEDRPGRTASPPNLDALMFASLAARISACLQILIRQPRLFHDVVLRPRLHGPVAMYGNRDRARPIGAKVVEMGALDANKRPALPLQGFAQFLAGNVLHSSISRTMGSATGSRSRNGSP